MALNLRRWNERLAQAADGRDAPGLASAFRGQRDAVAGTALPAGLPGRAELAAAGYARLEDLPDPALDDVDDARAELERAGAGADDVDAILTRMGFDITAED